jgi:NAD(P)H-nitrite reductase large subunit
MKIVIIGAGPAGVSVVETLRAFDQQSELVVFSSEPYPPYSPPALADHFMHASQHHLWRGMDWPLRLGVDYRPGTLVAGIDPDAHQVQLANGAVEAYDRLVIASGSRLYAPIQGADLPGVYNFKSLSAAEQLVEQVRLGQATSALIVGAGFIGMEIALLLRELGVAVTQVEMLDQLMSTMLDVDSAAIAQDMMRARGVFVRLNTRAQAFIGNGFARGVQLASGEILEADILIAATGVKPNIDFLAGTGIQYQWGITVDDHLRTSAPDVFAAGDVIESPDRLTGESYVHAIFPNAVEQGRVVGLNLAGFDTPYEGARHMNSLKHLGLPLMAAGLKEGDEVLQRKRNNALRTLYLQDDRLVGFQLVGDISAAGIYHSLMDRRLDLKHIKHRLFDPNFGQGTIAWEALSPYLI